MAFSSSVPVTNGKPSVTAGRKTPDPGNHIRDGRAAARRNRMAAKKPIPASVRKDNFRYKQELAHQLIRRFGLAAARRTCIENKWHSVLEAVNSVRPH